MIQAIYNGVSGLQAHKMELDVISDNIANVNTIGFKSSRVNFTDMLSRTIRGATEPKSGGLGGTNPMQIGLGTNIGSIAVSQTQGSLQTTGKAMDLAIEGDGFLALSDGQGRYYTRDGSLQLDGEGNLVQASSGLKVLGWMADASTGVIDCTTPISASSFIRLPVGGLAVAKETKNVEFGGNLDESMAAGSSTSPRNVEIYDSLGVSHNVLVVFTKTANPGEWAWEATSPDAEVGSTVGTGTITFDSKGNSTSSTGSISLTLASANNATNPIEAAVSFSSVTQIDADDSTVRATSQDGRAIGTLDSFAIGQDGVITGKFSNGMTPSLAQLCLARFSNPSGLNKLGSNILGETGNSGLPQIGQASVGSMGNVAAGFLEASNVDLTTEFANMIFAQRGFQANSRVITTSDEILQELVQLKR